MKMNQRPKVLRVPIHTSKNPFFFLVEGLNIIVILSGRSKRPFHLVGGGNNPITIVRYYDVVKSNHDCIMVPYDQQNGLLELHRNLG